MLRVLPPQSYTTVKPILSDHYHERPTYEGGPLCDYTGVVTLHLSQNLPGHVFHRTRAWLHQTGLTGVN